MSETNRKKSDWFRKEHPLVRRHYNKEMRQSNKNNVRLGKEVERHDRTQGWLTW